MCFSSESSRFVPLKTPGFIAKAAPGLLRTNKIPGGLRSARRPYMQEVEQMALEFASRHETFPNYKTYQMELAGRPLVVETGLTTNRYGEHRAYLSDSNFINLYHFAIVLNGRWNNTAWKNAKNAGREEAFLRDPAVLQQFSDSFKALSLEYKLSNINQAKAFARYMNEIGCFYTDKPVDFPMVEHFTRQELQTIGLLEHQRWLQEHYDMGWVYGTPARQDRERLRQHKDMIPSFPEDGFVVTAQEARDNYNRLDKAEQDKDTDPMECMLAMLRMFDGLRIYRLR